VVGHPEKAPAEASRWERAAFHFIDGQVLRASVAPDSHLGRFGGMWRAVEPGVDEMRTIGIPYTSLKGVFKLREWDSRPAGTGSRGEGRPGLVARVLAEREGSPGPAPRGRPPTGRH